MGGLKAALHALSYLQAFMHHLQYRADSRIRVTHLEVAEAASQIPVEVQFSRPCRVNRVPADTKKRCLHWLLSESQLRCCLFIESLNNKPFLSNKAG